MVGGRNAGGNGDTENMFVGKTAKAAKTQISRLLATGNATDAQMF